MKRMLAGFALLMLGLTGLAMIGLSWGWPQLVAWRLAPRVPFRAQPPLAADAYAAPDMWVSRPDLAADPARYLPPGVGPDRKGAAFVFFLHATTYKSRRSWNAPLDHASSLQRTALTTQAAASVFNGEAGVYAPRYRQAALGAFLAAGRAQQRALALAQADAQLALATFLHMVPPNAPIVLAGHDQGALILMRLIRDRVRGTPLSARIVAVYLAGWPVSVHHDLPQMGMPACIRPDQAGCVMAWTTFSRPADSRELWAMARNFALLDGRPRDDIPLCTNPLNGGGAAAAPDAANRGSLALNDERQKAALVRPSVGARCDAATGLLIIARPPHVGDHIMPGNNYSNYDFPLFWRNLRDDVAVREAAWTRAHP